MVDLDSKIVWLTGASDGIGAALIPILKSKNVKLIVSARNEKALKTLLLDNRFDEHNSLVLPFDLSKDNATEKTKVVIDKFGSIDVLILCAGVNQKSLASETEDTVNQLIMNVNFMANVRLIQAILPIFQQQKSGHIVVVSSIIAKFGSPYLSMYAASKHALNGYLESLRYEVEADNINISIVTPGFVATNIDAKALTKDGTAFNQKSIAQSKGISPTKVALAIVKSIERKKRHVYIGKLEILMPLFNFIMPKTFYYILKKLHKL